jgi:N utilization substance protein B
VARKLALQALYRWQLNAAPWQDLVQEFKDADDMPRADGEYFRALVEGVWHARTSTCASRAGRSGAEFLDPIDTPYCCSALRAQRASRVPIGSRQRAVGLAKRFGAATDTSSSTRCSIGRLPSCGPTNTSAPTQPWR